LTHPLAHAVAPHILPALAVQRLKRQHRPRIGKPNVRGWLVALVVCSVSFVLILAGIAGSIGSTAIDAIVAGLAVLPIAIMTRCFLDTCALPNR